MILMLSASMLSGCGKKSNIDNERIKKKWEEKHVDEDGTSSDANPVETGRDETTEEIIEENPLDTKEVYTENEIVPIADATTGDYVRFGYFEQDNDFDNGAEPLSWKILDVEDDGTLVLITEYVIDSNLYNYDWEMCTWDMCDARAMLNGPFYNYTFSKAQQDAILETTLSNLAYADYIHEAYDENLEKHYKGEQVDCYDGPETVDKVYYLDIGEVRQYMPELNDRSSMPTEFAKNRFLWTTDYTLDGSDIAGFWTRTPGVHNTDNCYGLGGLSDGIEFSCIEVTASYMGSRPVIRVDREKAANCENEHSDTADGSITKVDMSKPLDAGNVEALKKGIVNLKTHIENMLKFGVPVVVAINRFHTDTDAEIEVIKQTCEEMGVQYSLAEIFAKGGEGGKDLAQKVCDTIDSKPSNYKPLYDEKLPIKEKLGILAKEIYRADGVVYTSQAEKAIKEITELGFGDIPVCVAKTQYSLSDDPAKLGKPQGFEITVRDVRLSAGAGFVVAYTGDIMTMPGLPKHPAAFDIDWRKLPLSQSGLRRKCGPPLRLTKGCVRGIIIVKTMA